MVGHGVSEQMSDYFRGIEFAVLTNRAILRSRAKVEESIRHFFGHVWLTDVTKGWHMCPVCGHVAYSLSWSWAGYHYAYWDIHFSHSAWSEGCALRLVFAAIEVTESKTDIYTTDWRYHPNEIARLVDSLKAISGVK